MTYESIRNEPSIEPLEAARMIAASRLGVFEEDKKDVVDVVASLMDPTGGILTGSPDELASSVLSKVIGTINTHY